jgi:hypothetical protein
MILENIDLSSLDIDGIFMDDYPDFCDAYFSKGQYKDGVLLTNEELEQLSDTQRELLHSLIFERVF